MAQRILLAAALALAAAAGADEAVVRIDLGKAERTMAGGIGTSWHAIRASVPGARSSAWGANPRLDNALAWRQIQDHAAWLGLDWLRVQIDQRMYEPGNTQFNWDNDEMQTLYRILDWAETHQADVFLQQMWSHVAWNAIANVDPARSAPKSMQAFAEGLATLVEHLLKTRRYTCIQWLSITHEPGREWSWWQGPSGPESITPGLAAVQAALERRGLKLPLSAPGWLEPRTPTARRIDFDAHVGAYDIHWLSGVDAARQELLAEWTAWARERSKPLFLSELGEVRFGIGPADPGPASFRSAVANAEAIVRGLAVGVDAFSRCSFLNRGNIDGQWQLLRTWDAKHDKHFGEAAIEPVPYYAYALLSRFTAKHSEVLKTQVAARSRRRKAPDIPAAALRSPKGSLTILLVNPTEAEHEAVIELSDLAAPVKLFRYQLTEAALNDAAFKFAPTAEHRLSKDAASFAEKLPPLSITTLTTYALAPDAPGAIAE
ncbi:MAG TPA: hypothetical protein VNE39_00895 [Planctomycetota bacterium]|nr:hypothetical protein [Planctomycetota bacterium]